MRVSSPAGEQVPDPGGSASATAVFLDINGVDVSVATNNDVYQLVMEVAAGNHTIAEVAERLTHLDHRQR